MYLNKSYKMTGRCTIEMKENRQHKYMSYLLKFKAHVKALSYFLKMINVTTLTINSYFGKLKG